LPVAGRWIDDRDGAAAPPMKEDILEQLVDDYLQSQGYFTRHNVKFRPGNGHPEFVRHDDSVSSDIDVIGLHPRRKGTDVCGS
jgi:hypothetical protein